ncbi:hypothetical protein DFH94DRAFT_731755 [Russula ochroleuca]|uniref:Uncharacterized protein n=1 Tax=Russula ochroleuca TaxID=152965 RepID=A0A9P5MY75_9AGAM|nr:hypothetical protein DFH94DRAFT_731755 [Russula ochroleuca]
MFNSPAWGRILLGFEDTVLKTLLFPFLSTLFLLADAPYEQILIQYHQTRPRLPTRLLIFLTLERLRSHPRLVIIKADISHTLFPFRC